MTWCYNGDSSRTSLVTYLLTLPLFVIGEGVFRPPDLVVRTSGEQRWSNFMLFECAYSEFFVSEALWPDFREENLLAALESYGRRRRRFGGVTESKPAAATVETRKNVM